MDDLFQKVEQVWEGAHATFPPGGPKVHHAGRLPVRKDPQLASWGQSLVSHPSLTPRYTGPFLIQAQVNPVTYKLKLPPHMHIHPVSHLSFLKPVIQGMLE